MSSVVRQLSDDRYVRYHNDLSGIEIVEADGKVVVRVPRSIVIEMVAHMVRCEKVTRIEDMSDKEILGL